MLKDVGLAGCYRITSDSIHGLVDVTRDHSTGSDQMSSNPERIDLHDCDEITLKTGITLLSSVLN